MVVPESANALWLNTDDFWHTQNKTRYIRFAFEINLTIAVHSNRIPDVLLYSDQKSNLKETEHGMRAMWIFQSVWQPKCKRISKIFIKLKPHTLTRIARASCIKAKQKNNEQMR